MLKYLPILVAMALVGCASPRHTHPKEGMMHMHMMQKMDTNRDGKVSKEEFMQHHESMYDKMQKNKSGTVDVPATATHEDHS